MGKIKLKWKKIAEVHLHECEPDHLDIAELSPIIKAFFIIYIIIKKAVGPFAWNERLRSAQIGSKGDLEEPQIRAPPLK